MSDSRRSRNPFTPESAHIQWLLRKIEGFDKEANESTTIGRLYRDHASNERVKVHQMLCETESIGHVKCRKGYKNCPVFLRAVELSTSSRTGD